MHAVILAIGDELVVGDRIDTNSAFLSRALLDLGVLVSSHIILPDDRAAIASALRRAAVESHTDFIIATGGLGPTADDLTRFALADVLNESLIVDDAFAVQLRARFARRGAEFLEHNLIQVKRPTSARLIPNANGTAPGISAELQRGRDDQSAPLAVGGSRRLSSSRAFFLPGVPSEMKSMWSDHVAPEIRRLLDAASPTIAATDSVQCVGIPESQVGATLADLMARDRNPLVGTLVSDGVVSCRIRAIGPADSIRQQVESTACEIERRLGINAFARGETSLAASINARLISSGRTLVTAESCTGGLLGKLATDPSGSSACYLGGWVTYANAMKRRCLDIDADILDQHGAVSGLTADQMASGALAESGADFALAVTGVAGPDGGSDAKPVGTVFIALGAIDEDGEPSTLVNHFRFPGDRNEVRIRAAQSALAMLHFFIANDGILPAMLWEFQPPRD